MNKNEFHKRLKQILSGIKRAPNDSSASDVINFFQDIVIQKSGGKWNDDVATQVMKQIEWAFKVQPEEVRIASLVREDDILVALKKFLIDRKCEYEAIPTGSSKTPDGFILRNGNKYLCEIKSPLLKFDHAANPFGYKFTTVHRKILNAIHRAKKQFDDQDPEHKFPHILIYTSAHFQLCWKNFLDAISGVVINPKDGNFLVDLHNTDAYQATKDLMYIIDGYVWFQVNNSNQFYQVSYFLNERSVYRNMTQELFNNLYKNQFSNMDNFIIIK